MKYLHNIYSVSGCVSLVGRNPLKINLHVWFYFIVFLAILYNTCETGHIESSILLSLSASCYVIQHLLIKSIKYVLLDLDSKISYLNVKFGSAG